MKYIGFLNYDLDGCTSGIMLNRLLNFEKMFASGYGKLDANIDKVIAYGAKHNIDGLAIADWSLTLDQYKKLENQFDEIIYIDHHPTSQDVSEYLNQPLETRLCAGVQCAQYIKNKGFALSTDDKKLLSACNAFDNWKLDHKDFQLGYDLTTIFYKINFWSFVKKFKDGFAGFTDEEQKIIDDERAIKEKQFCESEWEWISDNELLFFCSDGNIVNDVTLEFDAENYWILKMDREGGYHISGRTKSDELDIGALFQKLEKEYPDIIYTSGGHQKAGGLGLTITDINDIIEFMKTKIIGANK